MGRNAVAEGFERSRSGCTAEKTMKKFVELVSSSFWETWIRSQKERSRSACLLNINLGKTDTFTREPELLGPAGNDSGLAPEGSGYYPFDLNC